MKIIEYFCNYAILIFILLIIIWGLKEKKEIFELFSKGVIQGFSIMIKLFPTLLGLIVATSMLTNSQILEIVSKIIQPIFKLLNVETQLVPLIILRPISGSTTMAIATELMKTYGVDSKIGIISSIIMGSTETTIFVATLYSSVIEIKDVKEVIIIGLIGDVIGIFCSILAYNVGIIL